MKHLTVKSVHVQISGGEEVTQSMSAKLPASVISDNILPRPSANSFHLQD